MSFSTMNWLKKNSGPFKNTYKGYYSKNEDKISTGYYYSHPIETQTLTNKLGELKEIKKQQTTVSEIDKTTGQNALHFILSNAVFEYEQNQAHEKTLLPDSLQKVKFNSLDDYLFGYKKQPHEGCRCDSCQPLNNRIHEYGYKLFMKGKSIETHKADCYQNYDDLKHEIKTIKERKAEQIKSILETILAPFLNDHKELVEKLLLVKDKNGKSPLHYSYDFETTLVPILVAIKTLSQELQIQILRDRGPHGENYLHMVAKKNDTISPILTAFGASSVLSALSMENDDNNTPLHYACALHKHQSVKEMTELLNSVNNKENKADEIKSLPIDFVFKRNRAGKNPLDLACLGGFEDSSQSVTLLVHSLGKQYSTKVREQDYVGCTALHHAVHANNLQKTQALLSTLTSEDKKLLARIKNNNKDTALHYACRSNNREILKLVLEALGPAEIYQIRLESTEVDKFLKQKDNLALLKEYNTLFDGFHYLKEHFSQKVNYRLREEDFIQSLICLEKDTSLPEINPKFFAKTHLSLMGHEFKGSEGYLQCRKFFAEANKKELEDFKMFLAKAKESKDAKIAKLSTNILSAIMMLHAELEPNLRTIRTKFDIDDQKRELRR